MSGHHHHHDVDNIRSAFWLNVFFTIIEFVGGFYVNSVAIMSDAIHDLGDSLSLGLSWYFQKLSHKGRTSTFSYGYRRFSVLSAIINSCVLLIGSVLILMETFPRLLAPEQPNTRGMIILAILGVIVNGLAVYKTHKGKTANEKVVSLHLMEDVLGWIGVLIGSLIMNFWDVPILDPILSLMIAVYILYNAFRNIGKSIKIILQGIPEDVNLQKLEEQLLSIKGVDRIHDMHTWSMDGEYHVMTLHLVLNHVDVFKNSIQIKKEARNIIQRGTVNHVTIELEGPHEQCTSVDQHT